MNAPAATEWVEFNRRVLIAHLARVRTVLLAHLSRMEDGAAPTIAEDFNSIPPRDTAASALEFLSTRFGLSPFERDVLLLAAGVELDADIAEACARAQEDPRRTVASFGLALAALPDAHWSALAADAPLRYWHLVDVESGRTLVSSALRIDERILHFLTGVPCSDARLAGIARLHTPGDMLPPSQERAAQRLVNVWRRAEGLPPSVHLTGDDASGARDTAAHACAELGMQLLELRLDDVPTAAAERVSLARLISRECWLRPAAVLLESGEARAHERAFLAELTCPVLILGPVQPDIDRASLRLAIDRPHPAEQRALWHAALPSAAAEIDGEVAQVASHYRLSCAQIRDAAAAVAADLEDGAAPAGALWRACRERTRGGLEALALRIEPRAGWNDLILPAPHLETLRDIARQVRHRNIVYETWGFAAGSARGLGLSALFAGESGTGKTLAAEVLAGELGLDLYLIDLSAVVSKYIGETEKNLKRVFDAAEASGAVLLFDEADALFGKRSNVKDSHDRYANIELAYLLQRMESYRGLAILTSNMKALLDPAFLRRIRFVVTFPFPDVSSRADIWRGVFPPTLPRDGIDIERLARLTVAGGNIRNIALNAAFYAADEGAPLAMRHLLRATRAEYAKLEKPLSETETGGWQ